MTLDQLLNNGASLRYRPPHGFYAIRGGERWPITQQEAEQAVRAGKVRPESKPDIHGVWHFTKQIQGARK